MLVTLEGTDGSGKTTQASLLVRRLRAAGHSAVGVHEPGGTVLGTHVRALLLGAEGSPMHPWTEAFLFAACRAQLVHEVVRPALERHEIVVADRFADSTLAYQGAGRGLPRSDLDDLVRIATGGLRPDLTVLLDLPASEGLARRVRAEKTDHPPEGADRGTSEPPREWNRFEDEGQAFQERVRAAFLDLARLDPSRWVVLDATAPTDVLAEAVWRTVESRVPVPRAE